MIRLLGPGGEAEAPTPPPRGHRAAASGLIRTRTRLRYLDPNEDGPLEGALTKSRLPVYPPGGPFRMYVCPQCGHVELFVDLPQEG